MAIDEHLIDQVSEEDAARLLNQVDNSERVRLLEQALALLPPEERAVILLFYWQGKSVEEIAQISGLSEANVKIRLFRIRKKLYVQIKKWEE